MQEPEASDSSPLTDRYPSVNMDARRLRPARTNRRAAGALVFALLIVIVILAIAA